MSGIKRRMERIERSEVRRDLRFVMYKDEYEALVAGTADAPDLRKFTKRYAVLPRPCETNEEWLEQYAKPALQKLNKVVRDKPA
jgi:capsid portal protein